MSKTTGEHPVWAQLRRRVGPATVFEGERIRPKYLGSVVELGGRHTGSETTEDQDSTNPEGELR